MFLVRRNILQRRTGQCKNKNTEYLPWKTKINVFTMKILDIKLLAMGKSGACRTMDHVRTQSNIYDGGFL